MKCRVVKKLHSRSGESIVETLVGLLISALALMMLAGALGAADRIITSSEAKMKEYFEKNNAMVKPPPSSSSTNTNTVTIMIKDYFLTARGNPTTYKYYINDTYGSKPVLMYSK